MGDDVVHDIQRNTGAGSQRHGLGSGGDVHPGQQLVDDFHRGTQANLFTNAIDLAGNGVQHRLQLLECRFCAGCHHRHLAFSRLGCAT
ncbi:hypothetical protein D3C80_1113800 [compost metagenome]